MVDLATRILLADDHLEDARHAQELLSGGAIAPYELIHARRLDQALQHLEREPVHVGLFDLDLPGIKGLETLRQVLDRAPGVPLIVLAADDDPQVSIQAVRAGVQDVLPKRALTAPWLQGAIRSAIERKRKETLTARAGLYDPLTGLPSRNLLHDRWKVAQARATRDRRWVGLLLLDLEDAPRIAEGVGADAASLLLQMTAQRLSTALRDCDTVSRCGDWQFAILLEGIDTLDDAEHWAGRIRTLFRERFVIAGEELFFTAGMAIAFNRSHAVEDLDDLLRRVNLALYRHKTSAANRATSAGLCWA